MKHVSGKDLCKVLERHGWIQVRSRGSHRTYEKAGHSPVTVPVHGNKILKAGTQRGIMKATGLSDADL